MHVVMLLCSFSSCDLDLDPMTLIYELDLDILEVYLHMESEKVSK